MFSCVLNKTKIKNKNKTMQSLSWGEVNVFLSVLQGSGIQSSVSVTLIWTISICPSFSFEGCVETITLTVWLILSRWGRNEQRKEIFLLEEVMAITKAFTECPSVSWRFIMSTTGFILITHKKSFNFMSVLNSSDMKFYVYSDPLLSLKNR